jgi:hypothetical protein
VLNLRNQIPTAINPLRNPGSQKAFLHFFHILESLMNVSASNNIKHGGNLLGLSAY